MDKPLVPLIDFTSVYNENQRRVETFALGKDGFLYNLCWRKSDDEDHWVAYWRRLPDPATATPSKGD